MDYPTADYKQIEKKPRKKGRGLLIILCILCVLAIVGYGGYHFYISFVEKKCRAATEQIMTCAHDMDISSVDTSKIPDDLGDNLDLGDVDFKDLDLKQLAANEIDKQIEASGSSKLLEALNIEVDYDGIYEQMLSNADYKIDDVKATYNRCTVTLTTSNLNYGNVITDLKKDLSDVTNVDLTSSGWWSSLKQWVSNALSTFLSDSSLPTTLSGWMKKLATDAKTSTYTGKIVYGIQNGHWTIISFDKKIIYNYYGFPDYQE